ncbi:MAG: hypothetical protein ABEI74_03660 [Candidatus Pacearchaeota archaeon]
METEQRTSSLKQLKQRIKKLEEKHRYLDKKIEKKSKASESSIPKNIREMWDNEYDDEWDEFL